MARLQRIISKATQVPAWAAQEWRFMKIYKKFRTSTLVPETMYIGNLRLAMEVGAVEGCVVECGCFRGGMVAGIADVLGDRSYYLFDSFEGLPPASEKDGKMANFEVPFDNCTASENEVRDAMRRSRAKRVQIVKGWFNETLPIIAKNIEPIALLRLDGDWYKSTKCILENFAPLVVPGGLILVDDYLTWEGCTMAVNEYAATRKWPIRQSWYGGVTFIRP